MMLLINAFTSPQFPWFVFPVGAFWMKLWRRRRRLDRYGLTWRQLLRLDPLPAAPITMADRLAQLAPPAVLASPHGAAVRQALDDRLAIADVTAQLTSTDRGLVPDVDATADALVTRISMLTATLEQLDRHLAGDSSARFAERLAVLAADDPQRELLQAQQTAWEQLHAQRADLQRQRESASLALRTLCFDVLKLRSMGVGAASDSVQRATQEARAVSADIARVLEAAEEVRRL
jgi:serine/threonine-protein kinase